MGKHAQILGKLADKMAEMDRRISAIEKADES